ncbi:MAG: hypothetical protein ACI87W_001442 [Halieaceae bacterium]|jgi:hypothetical protein
MTGFTTLVSGLRTLILPKTLKTFSAARVASLVLSIDFSIFSGVLRNLSRDKEGLCKPRPPAPSEDALVIGADGVEPCFDQRPELWVGEQIKDSFAHPLGNALGHFLRVDAFPGYDVGNH